MLPCRLVSETVFVSTQHCNNQKAIWQDHSQDKSNLVTRIWWSCRRACMTWNSYYLTKPDKKGIKQFHLVNTFIIWCLFLLWSECAENSLCIYVILSLTCIGYLYLTFSDLKQLIFDQTGQNGYQSVPFSVYIHNQMFVFTFEWVCWKQPKYGCDFITYRFLYS